MHSFLSSSCNFFLWLSFFLLPVYRYPLVIFNDYKKMRYHLTEYCHSVIDLLSSQQNFSYFRDGNKHNTIYKNYIKNKGWMGEPGQRHLMPLKKNEELDRDEKLGFCSGNDATTLFRILYKRCLTCKERDTLQVCYHYAPW